MLKTVLAITLLATSISTFAANSPITVQSRGIYIGNNANLPAWQLTLTSVDNDITVQSFTLNRGNCVISYPGRGKASINGCNTVRAYRSPHPVIAASHNVDPWS